jgi:hypothetical protein
MEDVDSEKINFPNGMCAQKHGSNCGHGCWRNDTSSLPDLAARGDQGGVAVSTRSPSAMLVPSPSACSGGGGEGGSGLSAL